MNSKVSQYQNTPLEFLEIKNFDFQTPGALTERWGSTQYVTQAFGAPITSLYEFTRLSGSSYVVVGTTGAIWYGATTGNSQGMSFTGQGASTSIRFGFYLNDFNFSAGVGFGSKTAWGQIYYRGITTQLLGTEQDSTTNNNSGNTLPVAQFLSPLIQGSNRLSFVTFVDKLFAADGDKFFKFDGVTTSPVGLPFPTANQMRFVNTANAVAAGSSTGDLYVPCMFFPGASYPLGSIVFYASYVNDRGLESNIWPIGGSDVPNFATTVPGITMSSYFGGGSFGGKLFPVITMNTPLGMGLTAVNIYYYFTPTLLSMGNSAIVFATENFANAWNFPYSFLKSFPVSGSTITTFAVGTTAGGVTAQILQSNIGSAPDLSANSYSPFGATYVSASEIDINSAGRLPRFLEIHKDRMFAAGFSAAPSTVFFSDITEPEGYDVDWNFEVRTNDGDSITAMRAYGTKLYVFKRGSFHVLNGDGPVNFFLQEASLDYGCLNNNSATIFEDYILFLDRKGLMMYNGAKIECLSGKVQPVFDRMNYSAALTSACMVHDKLRNQILIGIPVDGATNNNLTLVYDYLAQGWAEQDGFTPSVFARIQGRNNLKNAFYGTPSGVINWFGSSFTADNASGFTSYFKTRFLHDMGESVTKQWRRLYINADPMGSTYVMPVNFFQDYGSSVVLGTTFLLGQFQNRMELGIPSKSIAFELANLASTSRLRIYGFTLESRLQRRV